MMGGTSKGTPTGREPLMRFGPAPNILGVVGALLGGSAVAVVQAGGDAAWISPERLFGVLAGVVFGFGIGWLAGLIGAMGWLGE